jgi:hypothetical protein
MNKMIAVLEKHKIQWSVTSVPSGEDWPTLYAAWLVFPNVPGVWSSDGPSPVEALQNSIDPMMRHSRQSGWLIATRDFVDTLRSDLGELSPR